MRAGKLSKREFETVEKAWGILSRYMDWAEEDADKRGEDLDGRYVYEVAGNAVAGLCEFVNNYGKED